MNNGGEVMDDAVERYGAEVTIAIREGLTALGAHPDEVAATLFRHGFRGEVGISTRCPIACYLRDLLTRVTAPPRTRLRRVGVGGSAVDVTVEVCDGDDSDAIPCCGHATVDMTPATACFVAMFDGGKYPDLDSDLWAAQVAASEARRDGQTPEHGGETVDSEVARHAGTTAVPDVVAADAALVLAER